MKYQTSGSLRISEMVEGRGRQLPSWGANLLFGQIFTESCMKMKEFGPGGRPWRPPPRSANADNHNIDMALVLCGLGFQL